MDNLAQEWFHKAENDLLSAENNLKSEKVPTDAVCFHCQQCVEKCLKGYLVAKQIIFPHIHNLLRLLELCKESDHEFEKLREDCLTLNDYAVEIRYPDDWFEPDLVDAQEAFQRAEAVKKFVLLKLTDRQEGT